MYGPNMVSSGLSITKVLGGISKVLGVANQAIPLYKEIKPMVSNARKIMDVLKEFNSTTNTPKKSTPKIIETKAKEKIVKTEVLQSKPVFFQ